METKRLVGASLIVLFVLGPHVAVAQTTDNPSKVLKSQASGAFVSTNFDFDHPDLSTPANYFDGKVSATRVSSRYRGLMSLLQTRDLHRPGRKYGSRYGVHPRRIDRNFAL